MRVEGVYVSWLTVHGSMSVPVCTVTSLLGKKSLTGDMLPGR